MNVFGEFAFTLLFSISAGVAAYQSIPRLFVREGIWERFLKLNRALRVRWADRLFLGLALAYTLCFAALSILRYLSSSTTNDLAQYHQLIWNSLHGRLLENTFVADAPQFLGKSFTPILLALVPLYSVWSDPGVLLLVQTAGFAITALPLYWTARRRLGRGLALVVAWTYFASPWLINVTLTDFHEIALAAPILAFATFFLLRRHDAGLLVCLGLGLLTKEEIALITIAFGAYIFVAQRRYWFGLALSAGGAIVTTALLQYVIPFFRDANLGKTFYYFGSGGYAGATRYAYLGHSLLDAIATLLTRPDIVLQHVLIPEKMEFVLHFFVPLGFIPLFGAEVLLLSLPTFGYSLLSDFAPQFSIQWPYTPPLFPITHFALIIGLQRILSVWKDQPGSSTGAHNAPSVVQLTRNCSLAMVILVGSTLSYYLHSSGPLAREFAPSLYRVDASAILGASLARQVPFDAAVVVQDEWLARLSGRRFIYQIWSLPDYAMVDYLFADTNRGGYALRKGYLDYFLSTGYFEIVDQTGGFILAKRKETDHSLQLQFGQQIALLGRRVVPTSGLTGGMTLSPILEWRADQAMSDRYAMVVRVVDAQGHVWAKEDREPHHGFSPTTRWQVNRSVADQYALRLPPTMPAGEYRIVAGIHRVGGEFLTARDGQGNALGEEASVATVRVEKNKASFTASQLQIEQPLFVDMREVRLLGSAPLPEAIGRGERLSIGLYWRARGKPQGDYVVAVQLRDATGHVALEQAARPAKDTYPTTEWDTGEVLLDWHDFDLPGDLALGRYQIFVMLRGTSAGDVLGEARLAALEVV